MIMVDPKTFQFRKTPKEVWHDCSKSCLCDSPFELDNTILTNSRKKQADKQAWDRINSNMGKMFKDNDKDGKLNIFDKKPNKKNKKRFNLKKFI